MRPGERRKRARKRYRIYAVVVVVFLIAIIITSTLLLTHVRKIEIQGNEYCSEKEIAAWVQSDKYSTNSLYLWWKFRYGDYHMLPSVEEVDVSLKAPWSVKVRVYEKKIVGYIMYGKEYVYFDKEGLVMAESTEFKEDVPCIEGLDVSSVTLYEVLPVKDDTIFDNILDVTQVLKKSGLNPDRIVCVSDGIDLYFGKVCARLGNGNLGDKVMQISPILEKLGNKKGTLHLENFGETSETISFEKGVLPGGNE